MSERAHYAVSPIGFVRSALKDAGQAPKQGHEGAPEAWLDILDPFEDGLDGLAAGEEAVVVTWLHQARRDVLKLHPRDDASLPVTGVFVTRSQDRPNPLGLHRVTILERAGTHLRVSPLEAIDGTPILDLKPVLPGLPES